MDCRTRPETPKTPPRRTRASLGRGLGVFALLLTCTPGASPVFGDEHVLVGGLFDAEYWKTDDGSRLLSRNGGDAAPGGRLRLWAATDLRPRFQAFAQGQVADGKANVDYGAETRLEQAFLRYTFEDPRHLVIEAGQLNSPIGNYARRYMSNVN